MTAMQKRIGLFFLICLVSVECLYATAGNRLSAELDRITGPKDAVLVQGDGSSLLAAVNADTPLIPASTLKIVTALAALDQLGPDFRFKTEFYTDDDNNLYIKGYGDPLLVSEEAAAVSRRIARMIDNINDIVVDTSYFEPESVPGTVKSSVQPYDAPVGALCVNFNTIFYDSEGTAIVSAEPQTPMLPFAIQRIRKTGIKKGRIVLTHHNSESALYAGRLFHHFLTRSSVTASGVVRPGIVNPKSHKLLYTHRSSFSLSDGVRKLMAYSNNFIANQILIATGADRFGPPGTLEKGLNAVSHYIRTKLKLKTCRMVEGSGVSAQNRISVRDLSIALEAFKPYYRLLNHIGNEYYKTGTLNSVNVTARAGFFDMGGKLVKFAVIVNTRGLTADDVMLKVRRAILRRNSEE